MQPMARPLNASRLPLAAWVLSGLVACSSSPEIADLKPTTASLVDGTQIQSARSLLAVARVQRSAGNTPLAEGLLQELLLERPSYVGGHVELASMQLEVGNLMRARQALDAGLSVAPEDLELLRLEGAYYLASGDLEQSHARYWRVAEASPQSLLAARNLALVLVLQGKEDQARKRLTLHLDEQRAEAALQAMVILRARSEQQPAWKTRAPKPEPEMPAEKPVEEPVEKPVVMSVKDEPVISAVSTELPQDIPAPGPVEKPADMPAAEPAAQPAAQPAVPIEAAPTEELTPAAEDPAPVELPKLIGFLRKDWRGIPQERLARYGALVVQAGPLVQIQFSAGSQLTVSVDRYASTGTWVLGPEFDYRLEPGSRVRFKDGGSFFAASGEREKKPAPEGRPAADTVWP